MYVLAECWEEKYLWRKILCSEPLFRRKVDLFLELFSMDTLEHEFLSKTHKNSIKSGSESEINLYRYLGDYKK